MIKLPLVGPAYKLNAQSMSCQNCINWYPQTIEYPNGSRVAALMPTPGLKKIFQAEPATVRCLHVLSNGALLVVIGTKLYHSKSNKFELIEVGSISALNTVKVADNGRVAIIVNGTYSYSLDMKTLELNRLSGSSIPRSTHVLFLDGRFIVNKANTGQFHWSDLYSDKFNALSYATAESSPDNITALITFNRELWIFGAQTVERYYSTGSQNSPYARLSGGAMAFGCTAPDSIIALATGVIWLSQSEFGGHQIVMSGGGVPERISTHAIEEEISSFSKTGDAIAYAYQQEGHVFYVISFPSANTTFCFDVSTGLWHQRSFANAQGLHERHRSQHHAFFGGIHIVGDYSNGKLYQLDKQTYTDDGDLILRERTAQAVITDGKTTRFNNLEIVCETGFSGSTNLTPTPPDILGCEGAVDHIVIGTITDGDVIRVFLNDQLLDAQNKFFFRNGGASDLLRQAGIQVTPLTSSGLPATDSGDGRYYDAEQSRLLNTTPSYQKIRIEMVDANPVDQNFTPENSSFEYNPEANITTFCLSPASS